MTISREETLENLRELREGIEGTCARAERDPSTVRLVAASKMVPLEHMRWVHEAGVTDFGENYVKELRAKRPELPSARWHYIGTLQTGSAHHVAVLADVVQTIAGGGASDRLARRVVQAGRSVDVLIEVDFTGDRAGVPPEQTQDLADRVASLEGLRLIGLMTLPPMPERPEDARPFFVRLRELRDRIRERHPEVLELSMGMSLDYRVALEEGATMVRVGTALFGPRVP
jgi:pyridoxal phosphate enzyme (YggS family)